MLRIQITNKEAYPRQVQYYRTNKYIVVAPHGSVIIECKNSDSREVVYYEALNSKRFRVTLEEVTDQISKENEKVVEPSKILEESEVSLPVVNQEQSFETEEEGTDKESTDNSHSELGSEESISSYILLEEMTDEQLKKVIQSLGIKTRVRSRENLIELIKSSLPEEYNLQDYLND